MRRCALLAFLAAIALPSFARRVTVDQLEQMLVSSRNKPDSEIARRLTEFELTQRPTPATLLRWQAECPGAATRKALALLTDSASFLDLPSMEIPPTPAPSHEEQRRIMALTVGYVSRTVHQLPNFFATRTTTRFEDTPEGYEKGGTVFVAAQPLHLAGSSSATVIYRDGAEILDTANHEKARGRTARPHHLGGVWPHSHHRPGRRRPWRPRLESLGTRPHRPARRLSLLCAA